MSDTHPANALYQNPQNKISAFYQVPQVIERCITSQGELQLQQRGEHFEVISNGTFLMATYNGTSERRLVQLALQTTSSPKRVLIGGLGVGYSLAETLQNPQVTRVTVIEIQSKIIEWQRNHFSRFTGNILEDDRTEILCTDLIHWLKDTTAEYDVICLDIDNGPNWVVVEENRFLYTVDGLERLAAILSPKGTVAFWSAAQNQQFKTTLLHHFTLVNEYPVKIGPSEPDYVYIAQKQ
ncbi:spermine/spermidine synthase [Alicyclobacillaceae bacterium I2511]|nr:spermine/spermidine synthase [Alicyclobacillaceae bacterium I2511]